jgi:ribulose-5-phosphate 4-epimerase/fuculose-1-phosphate aldolase
MYEPGDQQDMLVRNARFGTALARYFTNSPSLTSPSLDQTVVLMRRHGFTTYGADIETAVYRAIYTKINAGAQTNALLLRNAYDQEPFGTGNGTRFEPMSEEMFEGCRAMNEGTQDKPWALWVAQVANSTIYTNLG